MVLLSPKFLAYLKKGVTHGQKFYFHPFVWNKQRNEPELSTSKWRLFLWYLNVLITVLYSVFVVVRSLEVNLDDGASNGKKIYMRFIIFFQAFPALFQLVIYLKKEEFCRFFVMSSHFFQGIDAHNWTFDVEPESESNLGDVREREPEQERGQEARRRKLKMPLIFELFFDFVWYVFFFACFGVGAVSALKPNAPDKISSILLSINSGGPLVLNIVIRVFGVLFQVYYNLMYCGNGYFCIFTGFSLFFPGLVVLGQIKNELSPSKNKFQPHMQNRFVAGSLTKEKVRTMLDVYKAMDILMKHFHQLFCTFLLPVSKIILMSLTVLCTYGAIKMSGFLAVFLATVGLLAINILIAVFGSMAVFHAYSEEILFLMKSPQFQRHLDITGRKYVGALTLIKIKMGSSYYVDKECVITVLQTVVDSTVDILIANS